MSCDLMPPSLVCTLPSAVNDFLHLLSQVNSFFIYYLSKSVECSGIKSCFPIWVPFLNPLCLGFLFYKMKVTRKPTSLGFSDN